MPGPVPDVPERLRLPHARRAGILPAVLRPRVPRPAEGGSERTRRRRSDAGSSDAGVPRHARSVDVQLACPHPGSHRGAEGQGVPGHDHPQHAAYVRRANELRGLINEPARFRRGRGKRPLRGLAGGIFSGRGSEAPVWGSGDAASVCDGGEGGQSGWGRGAERPPLSPSGAAMLPGHPGQEGRHHGGQRDHLRRRPRAPEERHRAAGRGQVSPPRPSRRAGTAVRRSPASPGRCRERARAVTAATWRAGSRTQGSLLMSCFVITAPLGRGTLGRIRRRFRVESCRGGALHALARSPGAALARNPAPEPVSHRRAGSQERGGRSGGASAGENGARKSAAVLGSFLVLREGRWAGEGEGRRARAEPRRRRASADAPPLLAPASASFLVRFRLCRKANVVLETRQLAMKIFEDYTVSWYWIIM